MDGRDDFGVGGNARPTARDLPRLGVDGLEADGFHFFNAPLDRATCFWGTGYAGADIVAELFEILVRVRVHRAGAGDGGERFESAVIGRGRGVIRASS